MNDMTAPHLIEISAITDPEVLVSKKLYASSRDVAKRFGKEHKNVLRDIKALDCSEEFSRLNFELSDYKDTTGRKLPCYYMTHDGFTLLVMGFTGKVAMAWKEKYIWAFNAMRDRRSAPAEVDFSDPSVVADFENCVKTLS
ncbi:Rha family transcriptional regulator [Shimia sp. R11_0]|uniref:Rha family transcriptional regulator n=1 Tax=Shimia sp. R11_0 TaxID=2821096 RepID=UPI001ADBBC70|nr:Rha family transcriptional regulator [Shimia sp. R11_0]MBO9477566.1 Rha family transcriptional regulator [Shimia sp. R11_0]